MTLLFVLIDYRLDLAIGTNYIRDMVIIGFMANELISIVENAGLMGLRFRPFWEGHRRIEKESRNNRIICCNVSTF